jgi:hypothetical protein
MSNYRKLVAAAVGIVLMLAQRLWGIDLLGTDSLWIELIVGVGTLIGVERLPNTPKAS